MFKGFFNLIVLPHDITNLKTSSKNLEAIGAPSKLRFTRKAEALGRRFPHFNTGNGH